MKLKRCHLRRFEGDYVRNDLTQNCKYLKLLMFLMYWWKFLAIIFYGTIFRDLKVFMSLLKKMSLEPSQVVDQTSWNFLENLKEKSLIWNMT